MEAGAICGKPLGPQRKGAPDELPVMKYITYRDLQTKDAPWASKSHATPLSGAVELCRQPKTTGAAAAEKI